MTLGEIIRGLDDLSDDLTICAARTPTWTAENQADLCTADAAPQACKYSYFLEVSVAKDVLRAWSFARRGAIPDFKSRCHAIIYYAENDAYLPLDPFT
jgi:hypothetical protein